MVHVPAGKFIMGSATGGKTEKPAHEITLTHAFDLDRNEVTAGDYLLCVKAGKCSPSSVHGPHVEPLDVEKRGPLCTAVDPAKARHPITCVDQAQAISYCTFVSKRLPTEAEWEYAARGPRRARVSLGQRRSELRARQCRPQPGAGLRPRERHAGRGALAGGSEPVWGAGSGGERVGVGG